MPTKKLAQMNPKLEPRFVEMVEEIVHETGETRADFFRRVIAEQHRKYVEGINPYKEHEERLESMLTQITGSVENFTFTFRSLQEAVLANLNELLKTDSTQKLIMSGTALNAKSLAQLNALVSLVASQGETLSFVEEGKNGKEIESLSQKRMGRFLEDIQLPSGELTARLKGAKSNDDR